MPFFQVGFWLLLSVLEVHYFCMLFFYCLGFVSGGRDWSSFVLITAWAFDFFIQGTTRSRTLEWLLPICLLCIFAPSQISLACIPQINFMSFMYSFFSWASFVNWDSYFFWNTFSVCIQVFLMWWVNVLPSLVWNTCEQVSVSTS